MTYQAYLDTIKAKTGKEPDDFKKLAAEKGLTTYKELMAWLKSEFEMGHGHANVIAHIIEGEGKPKVSDDEAIAKHFTGAKASWRTPYDDLLAAMKAFGADVRPAPTSGYISILRGEKKFAIVQITANRMDIGIKRKGTPAEGRFEEAGSWNNMVTHRVRIEDASQIDADVIAWLQQAYQNA